jgi:hypothetical protein
MGLADYQKQKEIAAKADETARAVRDGNDVLRKLLEEARQTNALLTQLVAKS